MRAAWLLLAVLLAAAACIPNSDAKDVFDWLDWIKGKITGQDDPQPPDQPVAQEKGLECSENRSGGETCTITAGGTAPEASALHRLLRYPSRDQLAARAAGQLHVVVTGGAYTSLPLTIPNNTRITVEEGAALVFDAAGADFYQLWVAEPLPSYARGQDVGSSLRYRAHLDCDGCRDVVLDGGGTIDGGGDRWWAMWAAKRAGDGDAAAFLSRDRPPVLEFRSCSNVAISGLRFRNAPWWALHPFNCSGVAVSDVVIESAADRKGADAIVLDSSRDVRIQRADISTGGDCVALEAGLGAPGWQRQLPVQNVTLADVSCTAPAGAGLRLGPQLMGGIRDVVATGWSVQHTKDAALLNTAWGCGGSVEDVLLQSWSVDNATVDVLRINAKSSGCESGWARTHTSNITLHGFSLAPGAQPPHIRVQGRAPLAMSGFHADSSLRSGAACWSPVFVGSICRAAPAFVMCLWLLAAFVAFVVVSALAAAGSWKAWRHYDKWRELRAIETADLDEENESSLNLESLELINLEHRRALSAPIEDSLEEPSIRQYPRSSVRPASAASQSSTRQPHLPNNSRSDLSSAAPQAATRQPDRPKGGQNDAEAAQRHHPPPAWAKASLETDGGRKP